MTEFADLILKGHSIVRLENDHQQQISLQHPRDEQLILKQVLGELRASPAFASKAFYRIPRNQRQEDNSIKQIWIEGVAIGGAMAIARRWRNSANGARVVEEGPEKITIEGVLMDYESNVKFSRYVVVSRHYKPRNSKTTVPYPPDLLLTQIAAGMSKAVRNAVKHAVPDFIVLQYLTEAKRLAGIEGPRPKTNTDPAQQNRPPVQKPLAVRFKELLEAFAGHSITYDQLAQFVKKDADSDMSEEDYINLLGLLNAIEEGTVSKETVFQPQDTAAAFREPGEEEAVSLDQIMAANQPKPASTSQQARNTQRGRSR